MRGGAREIGGRGWDGAGGGASREGEEAVRGEPECS